MSIQPKDFYQCAPPRIIGAENEYTTTIDYVPDLDEHLDDALPGVSYQREAWLRNGARVYQDCGTIIEYATPECLTASQVALHEKAGEQTIYDMIHKATDGTADTYKRTAYTSVKHNGQQLLLPTSTGHHENYYTPLVSKDGIMAEIYWGGLRAYLATRAIWAGTGIVTADGFGLHQKCRGSTFCENSDLTSHGSKKFLRSMIDHRLEVRGGDGNMSPWAIRQKFAMTSLVLRLIEHDMFPSSQFIIGDKSGADTAIRSTSASPACPIETIEGFRTPTQIQRAIARAGLDLADRTSLEVPAEEVTAAHDIIAACDDIDEFLKNPDALEIISDHIDWAAKLHNMLSKGLGLRDITTNNLAAVQHDLTWEKLGVASPSARWYRRNGNFLDDHAIKKAQHTPPETRAARRVAAASKPDSSTCGSSWDILRTRKGRPIDLGGPY